MCIICTYVYMYEIICSIPLKHSISNNLITIFVIINRLLILYNTILLYQKHNYTLMSSIYIPLIII